jgi:hypothetical protein
MRIEEMIHTHPAYGAVDTAALVECIEAAYECAQACTTCADACLSEDGDMDLTHCIRTDLDCADVCEATGRVLSRRTQPNWELLRAQVQACATACQACGQECRNHADQHEHCRVCAEACERCEDACHALLQAIEQQETLAT